eukprot:15451628-Alexandrium_andersonii.AAC.1
MSFFPKLPATSPVEHPIAPWMQFLSGGNERIQRRVHRLSSGTDFWPERTFPRVLQPLADSFRLG